LSRKHIGPTEEEFLQRIRSQMLTPDSSWELRRLLYELEENMARYPHSPEARMLTDRINLGMRQAERIEAPVEAAPPMAAPKAAQSLLWSDGEKGRRKRTTRKRREKGHPLCSEKKRRKRTPTLLDGEKEDGEKGHPLCWRKEEKKDTHFGEKGKRKEKRCKRKRTPTLLEKKDTHFAEKKC
jgi:hypothetical protein